MTKITGLSKVTKTESFTAIWKHPVETVIKLETFMKSLTEVVEVGNYCQIRVIVTMVTSLNHPKWSFSAKPLLRLS